MRHLLPIVAAVGVALAGCGEDERSDRRLIPQSSAEEMKKFVARAGELAARGTCGGAKDNVGAARNELIGPRRLDPALRDNLNAWLDHLREQIDLECQRPAPSPTPTPEATETATPEATETPSPTATASPPPAESPTPTPTADAPVEPPDTGGVDPGDGDG